MATNSAPSEVLLDKIRSLPPEKVAEVEDFVDFLCRRAADQALVDAASRLSEEAAREVWDNDEDAIYDAL